MTFELTLRGYNGGTDDTDDLVKWVSAPSREVLDKWLADNSLKEHLMRPADEMDASYGELTFIDGVDLVLSATGEVTVDVAGNTPADWIAESSAVLAKA